MNSICNQLVSIITPNYNSAQFIAQTIESVLAQSYQNWEMLIVDDCSTDNSETIIRKYLEQDKRIRFYKTKTNTGMPAGPRNIGIEKSCGQYIAFLDSDDIWFPTKLEQQLKIFENKNVAIVFSYYEKITESGQRNDRIIKSPRQVTFDGLLKGNCIGCLTAIYDTARVGRLYFQYFHYEDYAYWLTILKNNYIAKNTNTVEALYRVKSNGESSNKIVSMNWIWNIYRNYLKMSLLKSIYYFSFHHIKALAKYIK
jgi:glycosyltransferase involved in cell wall biosynthesis